MARENLVGMMSRRVTDGSMLRLIGKWISAGAIDDGKLIVSETGTGQGQPISPLLANIYLHQVLDEWFGKAMKPRLKGEAHEIRYADDAILCFQYREDAEKVLEVLPKRFAKFGLPLQPLYGYARHTHARQCLRSMAGPPLLSGWCTAGNRRNRSAAQLAAPADPPC